MKSKLKTSGIILILTGLIIMTYLLIVAYTTPNYNYAITPKPSKWLMPISYLISIAGILLIAISNKQKKNLENKKNNIKPRTF